MGNSSLLTPRQQEVNDCLIALTRLYGILEPKHFLKVFNKYHDEKLLKAELMRYSNKLNNKYNGYFIYENLIVTQNLGNEVINWLIHQQTDKPYYLPTEEEINILLNDGYFIDKEDIKEGYECEWTSGSIRRILRDPVYTGAVVNLRQQVINYKTKKNAYNSRDKWIIVPNMHEPIVTDDEQERVMELILSQKNRARKYGAENLFKGIVKCSVCGRPMILVTSFRYGKLESYFRCNSFTKRRCDNRHQTTVKYEDVKEVVIDRLRRQLSKYKDDDRMLKTIKSKFKDNKVTINYDKELSKITTRQNTLVNITKKVYDDYFEGLINNDIYLELIKKYQIEQNDLKEKYSFLLTESNKKENQVEDVVQSFLDLKVLRKEMVYNLINKIEVSSDGDYKQHKQRTIKIQYQFAE